jgi:glyoxylase-like metal-dependent hydrolase (beta-lactamase superfamily II)
VSHPGRGHTDSDVIVGVRDTERSVVFCGDLVEESGDPVADDSSDLAAWPVTLDRVLDAGGQNGIYVPGHGAVVDSDFVRRQQQWLHEVCRSAQRRVDEM